MRILPDVVSNYLKENHLSPMHAALFELDQNGRLREAFGAFDVFDIVAPEKESLVIERFPFLDGLLTEREEEIQIKDVNLSHSKLADVAILKEDNSFFVVFTPTKKSASFNQEVQSHNTNILKDNKQKSLGSPALLADILLSVNVMAWTPESGAFRLKTYPAPWFIKLFPELKTQTYFEDLFELFPYLDSFLPTAKEVWSGKNDKVAASELWSESRDNEEVYLQAHAVKQNNRELLLISTENTSSFEQRELIQKAREKSLYNEQLEKTESRLRNLLNFKNQFVSVVSHDLRSPLAGVVNGMELLLDDDIFGKGLNDEGKELLQEMYDELVKVLDYNQKLYHWSNLELGRFNIEKANLKASQFKQPLIKRFEKHLSDKQLALEFSIDEDFSFMADESLFTQVLNNLVQNAIKFSAPGQSIEVNAKKENGKGVFEVKDHGVGIPEKYQQDLFNNLRRHHSRGTAGEKGTGLGLSITKNIVDAHEMGIRFKSVENQGTSFFIDISI